MKAQFKKLLVASLWFQDTWALAISLTFLLLVSWVDDRFFNMTDMGVFYLLPIMFSAIHGSFKLNLALQILTGIMWQSGTQYRSETVFLWELLNHVGICALVGMTVYKLFHSLNHESSRACTDPLTGVGNRRAFIARLKVELGTLRQIGKPFSLIIIDLDDFKIVNDTLGHTVGDRVLSLFACELRKLFRQSDLVARWGGDEFMILLSHTDKKACLKVLDNVYARSQGFKDAHGVGFSAGALTVYKAPHQWENIVEQVDKLLYSAKKQKKNHYVHGCLN